MKVFFTYANFTLSFDHLFIRYDISIKIVFHRSAFFFTSSNKKRNKVATRGDENAARDGIPPSLHIFYLTNKYFFYNIIDIPYHRDAISFFIDRTTCTIFIYKRLTIILHTRVHAQIDTNTCADIWEPFFFYEIIFSNKNCL